MSDKTWSAGETVVIKRTLSRDKLGVIERITPTGIMVVNYGGREIKFNKNGSERGRSKFYYTSLHKATPEKIQTIQKLDLAEKIENFLRRKDKILHLDLSMYELMATAIDNVENSAILVAENDK